MGDYSVHVISREIVKPSSGIHNDHPKTIKLSYLDQLISPLYVPLIFFYQANETSNQVQISQKLKHSLSDTLTTFYPLAGRVNGEDNSVIDCNDAGVEFIEARVQARLMDVLESLDDYKSKQYIPLDDAKYSSTLALTEKPFLFMQITFFDCGGIALGICYSHVFADGSSFMMFINAWASMCRSHQISQMVSFDLASHFSARQLPGIEFTGSESRLDNKMTVVTTKMLVFDKEKIALLKKNAISSTVKDPTRVEVISAFIWKFMIDTWCTKTILAVHPVNLRGRNGLNLENEFGNCFMVSSAYPDDHGGDVEFHDLVNKLRKSIRKIDDDYISKSQNEDNYVKDAYKLLSDLHSNGEIDKCHVSSWIRFPFYEVDFGFGTPILFYPVKEPENNNTTILVNSKTGENIQAWVTMEKHILEMLENQINLISSTTRV